MPELDDVLAESGWRWKGCLVNIGKRYWGRKFVYF
jgi:hypothetical protein